MARRFNPPPRPPSRHRQSGALQHFTLEGSAPSLPRDSASPALLTQLVHLTLEWPILRLRHQPGPHRILPHVTPFLVVMMPAPELRIPKIQLPHRLFRGPRPAPRDQHFPLPHPLRQGSPVPFRWRTKQMQMIRHHHESPDHPGRRQPPGFLEESQHIRRCEDRLSLQGAHGQKDNHRFTRSFHERRVNRMFPLGQSHKDIVNKNTHWREALRRFRRDNAPPHPAATSTPAAPTERCPPLQEEVRRQN